MATARVCRLLENRGSCLCLLTVLPSLLNQPFGGQGGLVVKRSPFNQEIGGSNPTTATWKKKQWTVGSPLHRSAQLVPRRKVEDQPINAELSLDKKKIQGPGRKNNGQWEAPCTEVPN